MLDVSGGRKIVAQLAGLLALASLLCVRVDAQVAGGTLSGAVGTADLALPNVRVTLKNVATGAERVVTTGAGGLYTFPNLAPGTYEMTVDTMGFSTQVRTNITVAVGAKLVVDVAMQSGDPTEVNRVALSGEQASSASGNVSASTVRDSPLNGRDWTQLAALEAGVTGIQTGNAQALRGFGAAISVSGARPDQNSYRLDGISINDYSNGAPGSVLGSNLGADAVEQFSVLGSNYPAGYGRTSGGVINAVTRSGTNAFHGNIYEFLRNSALDARNFFDAQIPPFKRNQFGGSIGGPIQKNRTFFFADYEGLRQSLGVTHVDTVPSVAARHGQLSAGTVQVDREVARFLNAFYPLPNGPSLGNGDTGIYTFAQQQVTTENYFTSKIDRKFSERDDLSGTYMRDNSIVIQPDTFDELLSNVVSRRQLFTLREEHIFSPGLLNAARAGYSRAVAIEGGVTSVINQNLLDTSYGFVPGQFAGYVKGVPGLTDFNGAPDATHPSSLSSARDRFWNSFQWADDVFLTRGVHALQFGVVAERMQDNTFAVTVADGGFKFGSLADFLTNQPLNFQAQLPGPVATFGVRETRFGAYAQDDIRVRAGLNLSLGLRYEMSTVPAEAHDRLSNLVRLTDAQPHLGAPFFINPTLRNFEPRVGLAWSPAQDNKTTVRAGFGMFDVLPLPYEFSLTIPSATPFRNQIYPEFVPTGTFPTGAYDEFGSTTNTFRAAYVEHDPKRNYVSQWNLNLERQLPGGLTATLGYVGSHGVHEPYRVDNMDMVLPTELTSAGYLFPSPETSSTLNPNFGRISGTLWQASSSYQALQAVVAKSLSHGVQFHGAYTWGKSIDTLSATVANDAFPNGILNPPFFDQRLTRGLSDFDVGQNFVVNLTWQTPQRKTGSPLARWALNGWQMGGIYKASSGQPFTPMLGGDPLGLKLDETNEPLDVVAGSGCATLSNSGNPNHYIKTGCLALPMATPAIASQCLPFVGNGTLAKPQFPGTCANLLGNLGRNTVIGPGISNLDFSLFKNNAIRRISENFNVQFRAEVFNIFNRANFASPTDNRAVFDQSGAPIPSAGLITSTQTTSRQIQFALKVIW
ncbi:MAG TPA: carboxypeptidase regulatory-like domain-containing protein [Bryobacteraceae bacterium]|nr:carboxypeptidase regulatory-like domain-containing protein [Bryobacteraceae bacterium]